jgi:hypothetical protein
MNKNLFVHPDRIIRKCARKLRRLKRANIAVISSNSRTLTLKLSNNDIFFKQQMQLEIAGCDSFRQINTAVSAFLFHVIRGHNSTPN